jgi:hypothetical protein
MPSTVGTHQDPGMSEPVTPRESECLGLVRKTAQKLFIYCRDQNWAGYDPYDALNSRVLQLLPIRDVKWIRLALTQFLKRSPVDLRPVLAVPPTQNPKALALFLMAIIKLSKLGLLKGEDLISHLIDRLRELKSSAVSNACWGYSFPWQTRRLLVPRGYPNIVCTVFVGRALLEAYQHTGSAASLKMAQSAADYLVHYLYWTKGPTSAGFAYPVPQVRHHIYNADLLGAAFLCRIHRITGNPMFLDPALRVARSAAREQKEDGSWVYGELPGQQWIDNFHTGYNLSALMELRDCDESGVFLKAAKKGFSFYSNHFLKGGPPPRYYHDRDQPIDIHCVAQSILTLVDFKDLDSASLRTAMDHFRWAMSHMWSEKGYFYYRLNPLYKNKISYMRWSQAWMLLALSSLLEASWRNPLSRRSPSGLS